MLRNYADRIHCPDQDSLNCLPLKYTLGIAGLKIRLQCIEVADEIRESIPVHILCAVVAKCQAYLVACRAKS